MKHDVTTLRGRRATARWNRTSVGDIFERITWSYPDKEAIVGCAGAFGTSEFERVTFKEADAFANQIANALLSEGLLSGDRVMLACENSVEALLSMFGSAKAGLVVVPINPGLAPEVIAAMIENVQPRFAIVDAAVWDTISPVLDAASLSARAVIPIGGDVPEGISRFADWIAPVSTAEPDVEIHGDDIWALVHTSGTTATPKASMITHISTCFAAYDYALSYTRGLAVEQQIRMCSFLPVVHHVTHNESMIPALIAGGTAIIGRKVDAEALAAAITRERATAVWVGSPRFLEGLVLAASSDREKYDLSSLTAMMFAWNTIGADLHERLKELCAPGFALWETLGQTESVVSSRFWLNEWPDKVKAGRHNYIGRPSPLQSSTIVDEDGLDLRGRPGVPGEVVYRSPALTTGYYRDAAATEEAFRGAWFHSGDCCVYDEDGLLIMVDRFKDIVKTGGENVSSLRVEAVLVQHPDVVQAAVIGLPDDRWGEVVTAVIVTRPGSQADAADVISFARLRLAGFETPKQVRFVDALPQTLTGKILKHRLREDLT
jgi:acyl-CoA synthetase (AMP-forming)/AMP-acid ligase II